MTGTRTLLRYPGVSGLIELSDETPVPRANEVLSILSGYVGQIIDGHSFTASEFSDVSNMMVLLYPDREIYFVYHETGCQSRSIEVQFHPQRPSEVLSLRRSGSIC